MQLMKVVLLLGLMLCVGVSEAAVIGVKGKVTRTMLADSGRFGTCMAKVNVVLSSRGLDCLSTWVTFSCSGEFQEKDAAWRMYDSAQMAFALGNPVIVFVDDTKKHNGYCYANRIDVLP